MSVVRTQSFIYFLVTGRTTVPKSEVNLENPIRISVPITPPSSESDRVPHLINDSRGRSSSVTFSVDKECFQTWRRGRSNIPFAEHSIEKEMTKYKGYAATIYPHFKETPEQCWTRIEASSKDAAGFNTLLRCLVPVKRMLDDSYEYDWHKDYKGFIEVDETLHGGTWTLSSNGAFFATLYPSKYFYV